MSEDWFRFQPGPPAYENVPYLRVGGFMDHNGGTLGPVDLTSRLHVTSEGMILMGGEYPVRDSDARVQLNQGGITSTSALGVETLAIANSAASRLGASGNGTEINIGSDGVVSVKVASLDKTVPYVLGRDATGSQVLNTTTETTIASVSIPSGELGTDRSLRFDMGGFYLNNSGGTDTFTLRVKLGGTTYYADTSAPIATDGATRGWHLHGRLQAMDSTIAQSGYASLIMGGPGATTGIGDLSGTPALATAMRFNSGVALSSGSATTFAFTVQLTTASAQIYLATNSAIFVVE